MRPRMQRAALLCSSSRRPLVIILISTEKDTPIPRVPCNFSPTSGLSWGTKTVSWWFHNAKMIKSCLNQHFNKIAIIRYSSHNITIHLFKVYNSVVFSIFRVKTVITTNFRTFHCPKKETLCPLAVTLSTPILAQFQVSTHLLSVL